MTLTLVEWLLVVISVLASLALTALVIFKYLDRGIHAHMQGVTGLAPAVRHLPAKRQCSSCVHFDLASGQGAIAQFPAFAEAARYRTPAQMYNKPDAPRVIPLRAKWSDFGACEQHSEVRYQEDICDKYEAKS